MLRKRRDEMRESPVALTRPRIGHATSQKLDPLHRRPLAQPGGQVRLASDETPGFLLEHIFTPGVLLCGIAHPPLVVLLAGPPIQACRPGRVRAVLGDLRRPGGVGLLEDPRDGVADPLAKEVFFRQLRRDLLPEDEGLLGVDRPLPAVRPDRRPQLQHEIEDALAPLDPLSQFPVRRQRRLGRANGNAHNHNCHRERCLYAHGTSPFHCFRRSAAVVVPGFRRAAPCRDRRSG